MNLRNIDSDLEDYFYKLSFTLYNNHKGHASNTMNDILSFVQSNQDQFIEHLRNKRKLPTMVIDKLLYQEI